MTEVRTVSSSGGEKGVKPARFDLIPAKAEWQLAELFGKGAEKYADRNWERGYEWSKSYGALRRHLNLWWRGEDTDSETGLPHLAAVAWHAFALLTFAEEHPEFDDRPASRPVMAAEREPYQVTDVEGRTWTRYTVGDLYGVSGSTNFIDWPNDRYVGRTLSKARIDEEIGIVNVMYL